MSWFNRKNESPEVKKKEPKPLICIICHDFIEEGSYRFNDKEYAHNKCGTDNPTLVEGFSWGGGFMCNGYPMRPTRSGEWIVDDEATKELWEGVRKEEQEKQDLIFACRSRVLTNEEMERVEQLGSHLFVHMSSPGMSACYFQDDIDKRFNELLLQQFRLRRADEALNK